MNAENVQLWLHDLLTTNELQTQGALTRTSVEDHQPVGDCCIGRACKVAIAHGAQIRQRIAYRRACDGSSHFWYNEEASVAPAALRAWLGLNGEDLSPCYAWNDDEGRSFPEIAALTADHLGVELPA